MSAEQPIRVFVSYRRNDTKALSRLIYEALAAHFGDERVFFDIDSIPIGVDFHAYLTEQVARCTVLLAIIGEDWAKAENAFGEADFVGIELRSALALGIPTIPIFAEGACPPRMEDVPPDIQPILRRNGLEVDSGRDFRSHMEAVVRHAERLSLMHLAERAAVANAEAERLAREPSLGVEGTHKSLAPVTRSVPELLLAASGEAARRAEVSGRVTLVSPDTPEASKPPPEAAATNEAPGRATLARPALRRLLWLAPLGALGAVLWVAAGGLGADRPGPVEVRALDESGKPMIVAGARVSIGGQTCSALPCTFGGLRLGAGQALQIRAEGYDDAVIPVEVTRERQQVDVPLKPKRATLEVQASRTGLELFVDGNRIGGLPQTVGKLRAGEHVVRVEGRGFAPFEQRVNLEPGETLVLEPVLVLAKRFARVELGNDAGGASVTLLSSRGTRPLDHFPVELDLAVDESASLRAQKPGFVTAELPLTFPAGAVEHTFVIDLQRAPGGPAMPAVPDKDEQRPAQDDEQRGVEKRPDRPAREGGLKTPGSKAAR